MPYEWDERKRQDNLEKHRVDFSEAHSFDWDTAIRVPSPRFGEMRWEAIGYIGARLHMIVYTERNANTRIISLRKANARE